jgi:hypothetical protein
MEGIWKEWYLMLNDSNFAFLHNTKNVTLLVTSISGQSQSVVSTMETPWDDVDAGDWDDVDADDDRDADGDDSSVDKSLGVVFVCFNFICSCFRCIVSSSSFVGRPVVDVCRSGALIIGLAVVAVAAFGANVVDPSRLSSSSTSFSSVSLRSVSSVADVVLPWG